MKFLIFCRIYQASLSHRIFSWEITHYTTASDLFERHQLAHKAELWNVFGRGSQSRAWQLTRGKTEHAATVHPLPLRSFRFQKFELNQGCQGSFIIIHTLSWHQWINYNLIKKRPIQECFWISTQESRLKASHLLDLYAVSKLFTCLISCWEFNENPRQSMSTFSESYTFFFFLVPFVVSTTIW